MVRLVAGISVHGSVCRWRFHAIITPAERLPLSPVAAPAAMEYPAPFAEKRNALIWDMEALDSCIISTSSFASMMCRVAAAHEVTLAETTRTVLDGLGLWYGVSCVPGVLGTLRDRLWGVRCRLARCR